MSVRSILWRCLTLPLLVGATLLLWKWQFEVIPDGLMIESRITKPLTGWQPKEWNRYQVIERDGGLLLVLAREQAGGKTPGVSLNLGKLEGQRFLHVSCEQRWSDVLVGENSWDLARMVVMAQNSAGQWRHPEDHTVFAGSGTKGWESEEMIFELTSDMQDTRFGIRMGGATGRLEVKNLSILALKHRPWVPAATILLSAAWLIWFALLLRSGSDAPVWWRAGLAACLVIATCWVAVFPQTKKLLRPVIGSFEIGERAAMPRTATPAAKPPPPVIATPAVPVSPVVEEPRPAPDAPIVKSPASPPPATRAPGILHRTLRRWDRSYSWLHAALFGCFSFSLLTISGRAGVWKLALAVAILSEVIPEFVDHTGASDDWFDLGANMLGVALALLLWRWFPIGRSEPDK